MQIDLSTVDPNDITTQPVSQAVDLSSVDPGAVKFTPPTIDESVQRATQPAQSNGILGAIDDAVRMVAQGATFGYADEFAGRMNNLFGLGNKSGVQPNIDAERARDDEISRSMPVTSAALKLLGGVMSPVTKLAGAGAGALNLPRYASYALQGAGLGALAGAGESTEGNRTSGAITGAATGAVLGTTLPAIGEAAGGAISSVANRFSAPVTASGRRMASALGRDGMAPDDVIPKLQDLGPDATLADLGPNMRGLAEAAATQPGKSLTAAESLVASRSSGRSERLTQAALDAAGVKHIDEAIAKRSVESAPLWDAALAPPDDGPTTTNSYQATTPTIERLLTRPTVKSGINTGIEYALDAEARDGIPAHLEDLALKRNPDTGQYEVDGTPTLRLLEYARRGMSADLQGQQYYNAKTGVMNQAGVNLKANLAALTQEMDHVAPKDPNGVPLTKIARDAWGGPSDTIAALNQVQKVADTSRDGSDITGRLFGSKAARDKLRGLFSDDQSMADFAKKVANERTMADTERKLTGNSRTQYRAAAQADMASDGIPDFVMNIAQKPTLGNIAAQSLISAKNWLKAPPSKVADELTSLYSTDPQDQAAAIQAIRNSVSGGSLLSPGTPRRLNLLSGAAGVGGYIGGSVGSQR